MTFSKNKKDVLMFWTFNKETVTGLFKGQIQNYFGVSVEVVVSWGAYPGWPLGLLCGTTPGNTILVGLCSTVPFA